MGRRPEWVPGVAACKRHGRRKLATLTSMYFSTTPVPVCWIMYVHYSASDNIPHSPIQLSSRAVLHLTAPIRCFEAAGGEMYILYRNRCISIWVKSSWWLRCCGKLQFRPDKCCITELKFVAPPCYTEIKHMCCYFSTYTHEHVYTQEIIQKSIFEIYLKYCWSTWTVFERKASSKQTQSPPLLIARKVQWLDMKCCGGDRPL